MSVKTPKFWYKANPSWQSRLLKPIGLVYGSIATRRMKKRAKYASAKAKVLCIGNLTAGGGGKTPTAIALQQLLAHPDTVFLTRGYGGSIETPALVSAEHSYKETGDEALLLAHHKPTIISQDRIAGAKYAEQHNASLIIMDDGLQNPSLFKDVRICVIDGPRGFGNQNCIPAGPLRQNLQKGLEQIDLFIIIGEADKNLINGLPKATPRFHAQIAEDTSPLPQNYKEQNYIAFSGLAQPDKFVQSLKKCGIKMQYHCDFGDHHAYSEKELEALFNRAQKDNARLITTEKDYVRIQGGPWKDHIDVLPISLAFDKPDTLKKFLLDELSGEL